MARMIPHEITIEMKSAYKIADSEIEVFNLLRTLPDEYVCVWNIPFSQERLSNKTQEIDFIVLHPNFPLTVLEVKGGAMRSLNGRFELFTEGKYLHQERSPIMQAFDNRKAIIDKIRTIHGFPQGQQFIPSAAIAILTKTSRASLGGDQTYYNNHVLAREDLPSFQQKLEKLMATPNETLNRNGAGIGQERVEFLYRFFGVMPCFQVPLKSLIQIDSETLQRITTDHYLTLDQLAWEKRIVINGGAGTGKTVLATQQAVRHAREGKRTLLVCYNNILKNNLEQQLQGYPAQVRNHLTCTNYHDLCELLCRAAKQMPEPSLRTTDAQRYFQELEGNACEVSKSLPAHFKPFDCIVVDEGQDFRTRWWEVLENISLEKQNGQMWVFRDDSQNVQNGEEFPLEGFFSFQLLRNFRNSQSVFKLIKFSSLGRFMHGIVSMGPNGAQCDVIPVSSANDLLSHLTATLRRLLEREQVQPQDVIILSGRALDNKTNILYNRNNLGGIALARNPDPGSTAVMVETVRKYKGLENKYVLLVEVDTDEQEQFELYDRLIYVGASRAITALTIFARLETLERVGFTSTRESLQNTA